MNDGAGNHDCLDTRQVKDGDCPVVLWDHEGDDFQKCERVAPSFAAWLGRKLDEAVDARGVGEERRGRRSHGTRRGRGAAPKVSSAPGVPAGILGSPLPAATERRGPGGVDGVRACARERGCADRAPRSS